MQVAIVADTHVPSRATRIPEWVRDRMGRADHVIHAGDFDSAAALDTVRERARGLTAVAGNMDRLDLPAVETVTLGGIEFVVTHGTGPTPGYRRRVAGVVRDNATGPGPTVGVAGHTHEPLDTTVDGIRLLNPGSATGAAPAESTTMLIARVADGDLTVNRHER